MKAKYRMVPCGTIHGGYGWKVQRKLLGVFWYTIKSDIVEDFAIHIIKLLTQPTRYFDAQGSPISLKAREGSRG